MAGPIVTAQPGRPLLVEKYGVTDLDLRDQIVRTLGRKAYLAVEGSAEEGKAFVIVTSSRPSRAHWVFNKVMSIDPDAILIHASLGDEPIPIP